MVLQLFQSLVLVELIECESSKKFVRTVILVLIEKTEKNDFGESSIQYSMDEGSKG
jgi:hypothetical protein